MLYFFQFFLSMQIYKDLIVIIGNTLFSNLFLKYWYIIKLVSYH